MQEKVKIFAGVPSSELSMISEEESTNNTMSNLRSIEKEFSETNQHTKNTLNNGDNTQNEVNEGKEVNDSSENIASDTKKNRLGGVLKANLAINLIDLLIPSLLVLVLNWFSYTIDKKIIQLNKQEKEMLEPALQDVLNEIELDLKNPYITFGVLLAIVYGVKIIDNKESIMKKTPVIVKEKKGVTEAMAAIINDTGEEGEETTPLGKFEIDYAKLVDEVRLSRKRGGGDAKEYIAKNYAEKIRQIARKHGVPLSQVQAQLNYVHIVNKRKGTKDAEEFELE